MYKKILHITIALNGYPRPQGGLASHICHENYDEDCPDRRGLAVGLTIAGYGAGSALIGPLATALIDQLGWRVTSRVLGLVLFGDWEKVGEIR